MQTHANPIPGYFFPQLCMPASSAASGKIERYWHTIRHLRTKQICHQIRRCLFSPRLTDSLSETPCRTKSLSLVPWPFRPESYTGRGRFRFLNREYDLGWISPGLPRLWQYNLHYFDYLHQDSMVPETGFSLMRNWIQAHPVSKNSAAWEPYPLSLRLVNWIKFCSRADPVPEDIVQSLWLQTVNLKAQMEYHLMGNHLFANGKALWFAGIFLNDEAAARLGQSIIQKELKEQFLPDGGHFELSPMYHAILLEDILDMINLCQSGKHAADSEISAMLRDTAGKALTWLKNIIDEEGKIPLLNDSAYGAASAYKEIERYAQQLGIAPRNEEICKTVADRWQEKNLSGYRVLKKGSMRLIFDTAPLGPEYLPGHAHCDMLSVLLDFEGKNIFTDTGVYEYEENQRRAYSRGTSAHNTVMLDGLEQAELWKGFRIGRRGYPVNFRRDGRSLSCAHTGFAVWQKGLFHERSLSLLDNGFELRDSVRGPGKHRFEAFFHCAPDVRIESRKDGSFTINDRLRIDPRGADVRLTMSDYYPEFGIEEKRPCLVMSGCFSHQTEFGLRCTYSF